MECIFFTYLDVPDWHHLRCIHKAWIGLAPDAGGLTAGLGFVRFQREVSLESWRENGRQEFPEFIDYLLATKRWITVHKNSIFSTVGAWRCGFDSLWRTLLLPSIGLGIFLEFHSQVGTIVFAPNYVVKLPKIKIRLEKTQLTWREI